MFFLQRGPQQPMYRHNVFCRVPRWNHVVEVPEGWEADLTVGDTCATLEGFGAHFSSQPREAVLLVSWPVGKGSTRKHFSALQNCLHGFG